MSAASRLTIACDPQRRLLAFCTQDDRFVLEEIETGEVVRVFKTGAAQPAIAAFDPTGRWIACGTQTGAVLVYDLAAPIKEYAVYYAAPGTGAPVWRLLFSPDSTALAWVCTDQEIRLLDLAAKRLRATLPTYFGAFCVAFSRDGRYIVPEGPDHTLLVRNAGNGCVMQTPRGHGATVTCITAAPVGDRLASQQRRWFSAALGTGNWRVCGDIGGGRPVRRDEDCRR